MMDELLDAIINFIPKSRVKAEWHESLVALFAGIKKAYADENEELVTTFLYCTQIALPIIKKDKTLYQLYVDFARCV